ncbi:class I SAM-dependent methyltransferase [Nonomuraea sp. NPDC050790]|uniref:class I SAM-dependent methyltransferase n=1 Tax=Nonomuraea sp. NPDC050790 TaxID=3364371 RepID=UPI00379D21F2
MTTIAARAGHSIDALFGGRPPVTIRFWDGSTHGGEDGAAPTLELRSPIAARHLLWSPGELGLARAYVSGHLRFDGDLTQTLRRVRAAPAVRPRPRDLLALIRLPGVLGPRPKTPAAEARLRGRSHTRGRDRAAIAHHYDLSNAFYQLILDDSMAYSCAVFEPGDDLERAQRRKLDQICDHLRLRPGMRVLDVGCGWGSLALHAAGRRGVAVVGVTLSAAQRRFALDRAAGLPVDIRAQDYRDLDDGPYDAICSIEMGEHVGRAGYPGYAAALHRLLRPGGRALIQQMARENRPGGGPFIERYIAPDMHMRPLAQTTTMLAAAGFTVEGTSSLGHHYVRTVQAWQERLQARLPEARALIGDERTRVWQLYLAGGMLAFEQGRMDVHQIVLRRDR